MSPHTFTVYVQDRPGVLNRMVSLFRRRAFNIESLAVGPSETPGLSRMTIVVRTDDGGAARMQAQLLKLIDVVRVDDLTTAPAIIRELALIKVSADHHTRAGIMHLAQAFQARVVDVSADSLVMEVCGSEARVDGLVEVLRPYGVLELMRTGRAAMARTGRADTAPASAEPVADDSVAYSV